MAADAGLHLAIRAVHLLAMAVLLGGAAFTWNALRIAGGAGIPQAVGYEWVFWGTIGVGLVTGVGNLGAVGAPGPATRWGTVFVPKLLAVLVLVVGSFVRTLVVLGLRSADDPAGSATVALRRAYALTAGVLVVIVAIAEVLVYG